MEDIRQELEIHSLREVVATVAGKDFGFNISPKWKCRVVPEMDPDQDGYLESPTDPNSNRMLRFFDAGIPVKAPQSHSQPVHTTCNDGLRFIMDPRWCNFPSGKVAFKGGWAGPGTEMEDEKLHQFVRGFDEVLDPSKCESYEFEQSEGGGVVAKPAAAGTRPLTVDDILNLQLFHRRDAALHPQMPVLAEELIWPRCVAEPSVVCDNATRVSKRGAITWWHLDDCGEFVMQTGLRLEQDAGKEGMRPSQLPEKERTPVKLFIYGPPSSYDWFMHDAQSEHCQRIAALDILHAPCDALPSAELLPVVTVAILKAGGRPLISPPNIPHVVITLTDCVMVEQRRVMLHFLHEAAYFVQKMHFWKETPVVYKIIEDLQKEQSCLEVAHKIKALLLTSAGNNDNNNNTSAAPLGENEVPPLVRRLCVRSLIALCNDELFRGATEKVTAFVKETFSECIALLGPRVVAVESLLVKLYCDVQRSWPQAMALFQERQKNKHNNKKDEKRDLAQPEELGGVFWLNAFEYPPPRAKQFCAVLYYGGDATPKALPTTKPEEGEAAQGSSSNQEQEPAAAAAATTPAVQPEMPQLCPGAWRLRNGCLPCYGPIRATQALAEEDLRRVVARLASAAVTETAALTVKDIADAFVIKDELLDELF